LSILLEGVSAVPETLAPVRLYADVLKRGGAWTVVFAFPAKRLRGTDPLQALFRPLAERDIVDDSPTVYATGSSHYLLGPTRSQPRLVAHLRRAGVWPLDVDPGGQRPGPHRCGKFAHNIRFSGNSPLAKGTFLRL